MTETELLADRARRVPEMPHAGILDDPVRKHDADGIGTLDEANGHLPVDRPLSDQSREVFSLAMEFVMDCCSPEAYGHALPKEVVARAGRLIAMMRPKRPE